MGRIPASNLQGFLKLQGVPVAFMSGYTADIIAEHGILDEGMEFIPKPFTRMELTSKVRSVINSRGSN